MDHRPTLHELRELYSLTPLDLARAAGVELDLVYLMLRGMPIPQEEAERVLVGLSRLSGRSYHVDDLDIALLASDAV